MQVPSLSHMRRAAYTSVPSWTKPLATRCFYTIYPGASWSLYEQKARSREAFADRFFDSRAEFEAYEAEFEQSRVPGLLYEAWQEHSQPIYDSHKEECVRYYALVRKLRPASVVETGVYSGVSTLALLAALDENDHGTLYSIDCSAQFDELDAETKRHYERRRPSCCEDGSHLLPGGKRPGWIVPDGLRDRWQLVAGRPQRELPQLLEELDEIELFVHDSEHSETGMLFEFDLAWEHLAPGGVLVSPHVGWNDAFDTFVTERAPEARHGELAVHYVYFDEYDGPGWCRYAQKPAASRNATHERQFAETAAKPVADD
ncbi:O-methyltransferase [Haloprofundus sp. MHR1]|uniref:O-methyltransferase n=1 Tax=Haloprofundus sp. MHR1 TaxID=2572921 RepID=UPI0010BECA90|nr:class I SAM-dependent methyltransferase [Haloprofundus sp. MHR1]QCJ47202.1 class I SAM-dependent methyltransferase [Haloprofundus sp. MHR1]